MHQLFSNSRVLLDDDLEYNPHHKLKVERVNMFIPTLCRGAVSVVRLFTPCPQIWKETELNLTQAMTPCLVKIKIKYLTVLLFQIKCHNWETPIRGAYYAMFDNQQQWILIFSKIHADFKPWVNICSEMAMTPDKSHQNKP